MEEVVVVGTVKPLIKDTPNGGRVSTKDTRFDLVLVFFKAEHKG